jgi:hypothetical protein
MVQMSKQITDILDSMLADIAFTAPVGVEDCKAVYSALKETLPGSSVEVYCHGTEVVIRADNVLRRVAVS